MQDFTCPARFYDSFQPNRVDLLTACCDLFLLTAPSVFLRAWLVVGFTFLERDSYAIFYPALPRSF